VKQRYYAAAGGLVVRGGQLLLLHKHRQNEYVLPKGHIEAGETQEQTALRETQEETGYAHLDLLANLGTLRAEFTYQDRWTVRDETYFLMRLVDEARVTLGDYDDATHDAETFHRLWVPIADAAARLTFEPAKTFAARAAAWLQANPLTSAA
jgi:8-oxo-dGTP pyrophosphatase MutT (NUDIX family)